MVAEGRSGVSVVEAFDGLGAVFLGMPAKSVAIFSNSQTALITKYCPRVFNPRAIVSISQVRVIRSRSVQSSDKQITSNFPATLLLQHTATLG